MDLSRRDQCAEMHARALRAEWFHQARREVGRTGEQRQIREQQMSAIFLLARGEALDGRQARCHRVMVRSIGFEGRPVRTRLQHASRMVVPHAQRLGVRVPEVIPVDVVLDVELPVRLELIGAADHFAERVRPIAADHISHPCKPGIEFGCLPVGIDEEQSPPFGERHFDKAPVVEIHQRQLILTLRNVLQGAVEAVLPAVIGADHGATVAGLVEHLCTAMAAHVVEGAERAALVSNDEDRAAANLGRQEISGLGQLARITDVVPRPAKQSALFVAEPALAVVSLSGQAVAVAGLESRDVGQGQAPSFQWVRITAGSVSAPQASTRSHPSSALRGASPGSPTARSKVRPRVCAAVTSLPIHRSSRVSSAI